MTESESCHVVFDREPSKGDKMMLKTEENQPPHLKHICSFLIGSFHILFSWFNIRICLIPEL